jgi:hypothetical protein
LGVAEACPEDYIKRYGPELRLAKDIPLDGFSSLRAVSLSHANSLPELVGDLQALKLVNLDKYSLSAYRNQLNGGGAGEFSNKNVFNVTTGDQKYTYGEWKSSSSAYSNNQQTLSTTHLNTNFNHNVDDMCKFCNKDHNYSYDQYRTSSTLRPAEFVPREYIEEKRETVIERRVQEPPKVSGNQPFVIKENSSKVTNRI